jgi:adenine-specific DNA-methyltransferase
MSTTGLLESVDFSRLDANRKLDPKKRSNFGQFMTPAATARLMASMFRADFDEITLLDAGAGVGSLTAGFVDEICGRERRPKAIYATTYEIDPALVHYLRGTLLQCERTCDRAGIQFHFELINKDFIDEAIRALREQMFIEPSSITAQS